MAITLDQLQADAEAINKSSTAIRKFALDSVQYEREQDARLASLEARVAALETSDPTDPPPTPESSRFGIATGAGPQTPWGERQLSDTDLERYFSLADEIGARGLRTDVTSTLDPRTDAIVAKHAERGMHFLAAILPGSMMQLSVTDFAARAEAIARDLAPFGVREFQLGNEPNLGSNVNPAGWRERQNAALTAIKSFDDTLTVISAGLAPKGTYGEVDANGMNQLTFLERALAAGPLMLDVFGYHGYEYWGGFTGAKMFGRKDDPNDPWSALGQLYKLPKNAISILASAGLTPKVEITEIGVPTTTIPQGTTDQAQADFINLLFPWWEQQPWARNLWWYSLLDRSEQASNTEGYFGLVRSDWTTKPGFVAFGNQT
jgi:hypothetical protein